MIRCERRKKLVLVCSSVPTFVWSGRQKPSLCFGAMIPFVVLQRNLREYWKSLTIVAVVRQYYDWKSSSNIIYPINGCSIQSSMDGSTFIPTPFYENKTPSLIIDFWQNEEGRRN